MPDSRRGSNSRLEIWFKDEIENTLSAIDLANEELFEIVCVPEMQLYRQGYQAALRAVAEAFGIRRELTANGTGRSPNIIDANPR